MRGNGWWDIVVTSHNISFATLQMLHYKNKKDISLGFSSCEIDTKPSSHEKARVYLRKNKAEKLFPIFYNRRIEQLKMYRFI